MFSKEWHAFYPFIVALNVGVKLVPVITYVLAASVSVGVSQSAP